MCGIAGIVSSARIAQPEVDALQKAINQLSKRGPDAEGMIEVGKVCLGHRRLSIIDLSTAANQPLQDENGDYSIVFNGEIYNYKTLRNELEAKGAQFKTSSDTEVLLQAYKHYGTAFLNKLHGFFALAIYDKKQEITLLARDRFGIKPLIYCKTEEHFYFASEMKAMMQFNIEREIDQSSLYAYLQLNYIPEPHSIFTNVKKLEPGQYLKIDNKNNLQLIPYYQMEIEDDVTQKDSLSYEDAQLKLIKLLDQSVQERLVADVPLGTFLSGGIDSSLITALASHHKSNLSTFSIGYKNNPHFDETYYAKLVADKYHTDHHVFYLSNQDLLDSLHDTLEYIDEPFADSSALAVNALSSRTAEHLKVALSGDGADEMFAGYNKHLGEFKVRQDNLKTKLVNQLEPFLEVLPKSRNTALGNLTRKLYKFSRGSKLSEKERYWLWASLMNEAEASSLLLNQPPPTVYHSRKNRILEHFNYNTGFNHLLATDMELVLRSDMLRKVDLMSMSHGLEVRTPFLDHHLVNFTFGLPAHYKINKNGTKQILRDAAKQYLPEELYLRPKQGFEVPLLQWFNKELHSLIHEDLLSDTFIREQNIFDPVYVKRLREKLKSKNPEDVQANVWAIIVFNHWWKRYIA